MFECWGVVLSPPVLWTSDVCYFELHLFPPSSFAAYQRRDSLNTWHILLIKKLEKGTQPIHLGLYDYVSLFGGLRFFWSFRTSPPNVRTFWEGSRYQIGWIFGKIPNGLWPPPLIFGKSCFNFFYNGYARRYEGQIVWNVRTCLLQSVFCFDFSQYNCWKKHTLNPEFTLFVSISCSKSPV